MDSILMEDNLLYRRVYIYILLWKVLYLYITIDDMGIIIIIINVLLLYRVFKLYTWTKPYL
jgi:hypothetical protein